MKIIFYSRVHLALFISSVIMSAISFVGIFFNPYYTLYFAMSVILAIAFYKEKRW